ncbi:MAG: GAF domain-containing protein [Gammaproteobacteria bacterium]|nr:GAF domain-containing protein [Gammaproteobacteria bacterium]
MQQLGVALPNSLIPPLLRWLPRFQGGVLILLAAGIFSDYNHWMLLSLALIAMAALLLQQRWLQQQLLLPAQQLDQALQKLDSREVDGAVAEDGDELVRNLAHSVNCLLEEHSNQLYNLNGEIRRQKEKFQQKTNSLQILYQVATVLNSSRDLPELLEEFLKAMEDLVLARAGIIRILDSREQLVLFASRGIDEATLIRERIIPLHRCLCGNALTSNEVLFQRDLTPCNSLVQKEIFIDKGVELIAIPLLYRGRKLGIYSLFIGHDDLNPEEDLKALFSSIGQHLGITIEQVRLDETSKRHTIIKERNTLAHELHDSLAQTLASLRFQISMLDDSISVQSLEDTRNEISQIKGGLDEAYMELRELLAHFRAPLGTNGLLPALEDLISKFRHQTGMHVLLQNEWKDSDLPANLELQVIRIIQESLNNVRKHSRANTVRVLIRCSDDGDFTLLIEDDGVGMDKPAFSGHPGEHLGLSIMQERAQHLGGKLRIESEPGEGTRVQLSFSQPHDKVPQERHFALI